MTSNVSITFAATD